MRNFIKGIVIGILSCWMFTKFYLIDCQEKNSITIENKKYELEAGLRVEYVNGK